jgi:nucleoid-associated protein YejK
MSLNIRKMALSTTLRLDRFSDINSDENYLTFLTGLRDLSDYYKDKFIGCDNVLKSKVATDNAMNALESFVKKELLYDEKHTKEVRDKFVDFCYGSPFEINFRECINLLFPSPKIQEDFYSYVEKENLEVSCNFKANKASLRPWKKLYSSFDGIKLEANSDKIDSGAISYDEESCLVFIKDPSKNIINEIKKFEDQ